MKIRRAKVALGLFIAFLLFLILTADSGRGQWMFALANKIPDGDKIGHVLLFGILSFLVNLLLGASEIRVFGARVFKGSAVIMAIVTLEESSQVFFRSRTFDLMDLMADVVGISIFGYMAKRYLVWKRRQLELRRVAADNLCESKL